MKIYLLSCWVLTDEYPMEAKGAPVLIDLETGKTYCSEDRIMGVSAKQVVSLGVEAKGGNYLLPEEMRFISRFKRGDRSSQPVQEACMRNVKITHEELESLRRG